MPENTDAHDDKQQGEESNLTNIQEGDDRAAQQLYTRVLQEVDAEAGEETVMLGYIFSYLL